MTKMIDEMIARLEELKEGKHGDADTLTFSKVMLHVFDIAKHYALESGDMLALAGMRNITLDELKTASELDKQ